MGHNGFLNNVSITLIDKTEGKNPKKREDYWRRILKTYSPSGVNVEDSVWRTPYSFICDICITFYGIAWILVRQWPFKDTEFGNDFLGLFGNTFRFGLALCGSRFGIFHALFICLYCFFLFFVIFLSLFIYIVSFFFFVIFLFVGVIVVIFLASIRSEFLWGGLSTDVSDFLNINLLNEFIMVSSGRRGGVFFGTVACWWHAISLIMKYSTILQDCFLWGSVFPVYFG